MFQIAQTMSTAFRSENLSNRYTDNFGLKLKTNEMTNSMIMSSILELKRHVDAAQSIWIDSVIDHVKKNVSLNHAHMLALNLLKKFNPKLAISKDVTWETHRQLAKDIASKSFDMNSRIHLHAMAIFLMIFELQKMWTDGETNCHRGAFSTIGTSIRLIKQLIEPDQFKN